MFALLARVCLAATITGSALGALREYNHQHQAAALHVYACASSVWVPLPSADAYLYDNQDDLELPPVNIRFLPPLIDYLFQTVAIFYLLFFHLCAAAAPYIKVCKRSDPNINACITNSIEDLREKLATGIPELEAPAIEPLNLDQIRLLRGPTGARLDINVTGLQVNMLFLT
ncbi:hypothetical protein TSAR_013149 [Trichomalopsis sarcophagae]|uniref:Uncharacterized protein n=1 Tax=Trichomalopsis sarcophagae TaxID=543379 RepID=A0A232FHT1_9HYME|nr:hypothetical protein TSAR_013149 [Trichomalopsis sarcophagae]